MTCTAKVGIFLLFVDLARRGGDCRDQQGKHGVGVGVHKGRRRKRSNVSNGKLSGERRQPCNSTRPPVGRCYRPPVGRCYRPPVGRCYRPPVGGRCYRPPVGGRCCRPTVACKGAVIARAGRLRAHKTPARELLLFKPVKQWSGHLLQRHSLLRDDDHAKGRRKGAQRVGVAEREPRVQLAAEGCVVLIEEVVQGRVQAVGSVQHGERPALFHALLDAHQVCQELRRTVVMRKFGADHHFGGGWVQKFGVEQQRQHSCGRVRAHNHEVPARRVGRNVLAHELRHGRQH